MKFEGAKEFIVRFLNENLDPKLLYHSTDHSLDVCEQVELAAINYKLEQEEIILLKTAALLHDSGFIKSYFSNEALGVEFAKEILPAWGYSEKQINRICELIWATEMHEVPETISTKIIKDADLDYLGRADYFERASRLKQELDNFSTPLSNADWVQKQVAFIEQHTYFTEYFYQKRQGGKLDNLREIKRAQFPC